IEDIISKHYTTRNTQNPRDLIDTYLTQFENDKDNPNSSFSEENLMLILDLFVAGTETTFTTLRWGLLFMMIYPDIQARCHEEIDRVVGLKRLPHTEDRHNLPYTVDAVIHEIQRFGSNVVPLGVGHTTTKDVVFQEYLIPKNTLVMLNLMSVLNDESQWKTHKFNPNNFLDINGQFVKPDTFLPFSAGPRICLGEHLAKVELFISFISLLQHLRIIGLTLSHHLPWSLFPRLHQLPSHTN
ncbi:LOW QUALITY PROTEIN: cytochrome P450 2D6-like, partial [Lethenteron reissneri]|uniref:LOW QUALITY PROTEIN: cytochrome P450 2D6-like n=1 Tax=Lethenteron reissneri TaxID=7753 RepID=UPI002AB78ADB